MDAANIDLKAFTERFYHKITGRHLAAVLDTLQYIYHDTSVWLELTTLIIPDENDSSAELEQMTQGACNACGAQCAGHFKAQPDNWRAKRIRVS